MIVRRFRDALTIDETIESTIRAISVVDSVSLSDTISFLPNYYTIIDTLFIQDYRPYSFAVKNESIIDSLVPTDRIKSRLDDQNIGDTLTVVDDVTIGIRTITPMDDTIVVVESIGVISSLRHFSLDDSLVLRESKSGGETF